MASRVCLAMFGPSRSRQNRRRKADRQVVGKVRQQYLRITASSSSVSSWLSILPEKKNFVYIHTLASLTRIVIMHNIKQWILILKNGNILKLKEQLHKIFAGLGICSFAHKILLFILFPFLVDRARISLYTSPTKMYKNRQQYFLSYFITHLQQQTLKAE